MKALEIYEAAYEATQMNDLHFDSEYLEKYADGAFGIYLGTEEVKQIMDAHHARMSYTGVDIQDNYYRTISEPLSEIEIS